MHPRRGTSAPGAAPECGVGDRAVGIDPTPRRPRLPHGGECAVVGFAVGGPASGKKFLIKRVRELAARCQPAIRQFRAQATESRTAFT
jgi:hypothetical protein